VLTRLPAPLLVLALSACATTFDDPAQGGQTPVMDGGTPWGDGTGIGDGTGDGTGTGTGTGDGTGTGMTGVLVDAFSVSADGTTTTSKPLTTGKSYRVVVSGTFIYGVCNETDCPGGATCGYTYVADAYNSTNDCWTTSPPESRWVGLWVDDTAPYWGDTRDDHTYEQPIVGTGQGSRFRIFDCADCYNDNTGKLAVAIYDDAG
jgi:hypothetical protein